MVEAKTFTRAKNYEVDNTYSVAKFYCNQKLLAERDLDEECVETLKTYMGDTQKNRKMKINAFIQRAKTVNNCLPQMNIGGVNVTEREMLKLVILKNIPTSWALDSQSKKSQQGNSCQTAEGFEANQRGRRNGKQFQA